MKLDYSLVAYDTTRWLQGEFSKRGFRRAVLGLSGGIDSAVVAALTVGALGPENVHCLIMPSRTTKPETTERAIDYAVKLKAAWIVEELQAMQDAYRPVVPQSTLQAGNLCARLRMAILYDYAAKYEALVVGTSNKTEILLGYGTRWGDAACDINPLGELYKTEIRQLAEVLEVPEPIRQAVSSADLWPGQTDEGELGMTYEEMDVVLMRPQSSNPYEIERRVWERVAANRFKSEPIPICPRQ